MDENQVQKLKQKKLKQKNKIKSWLVINLKQQLVELRKEIEEKEILVEKNKKNKKILQR